MKSATREDIILLEKRMKELSDINNKYLKEKKNLEMTNEYLMSEIESKKVQIVKYMKSLSRNNEQKTEKENNAGTKKANLFVMEEQIIKLLNSVQKSSNAHLQEKYKSHIEYLYNLQKEMKVSYILIKKLDIKEEFLRSNRLAEMNNFFENLKNLSKIGRLNYYNLKTCGPILMYRINLTSTFDEVIKKCCDIWNLSLASYSLYDDSFNNLECCNDSKINDFFASYQPNDPTLGQGQIVFYLVEKLKNQKELLESQDKSIDSKADASDDNANKNSNVGGNDLENCLELIKNGKILKGIDNFKTQRVDLKQRFIDTAKMVDNNIFFVFVTLTIICSSIYSIASKKNISNWSTVNWENKVFLSSFPPQFINDMYDVMNYYIGYINTNNSFNTMSDSSDILFYGPSRIRILQMNTVNCFTNFVDSQVYSAFMNISNIICYKSNHDNTSWNTTSILKYNFVSPEKSNISHSIVSQVGSIDKAGIIIDINYRDQDDLRKKIQDLNYLADRKNKLLENNIQAIEYMFNIYDPKLDVFISNVLLFQRDINYAPILTLADSVPFITNVYETASAGLILNTDLLRCGLFLVLLCTIPIRIYQKYSASGKKGCGVFIRMTLVVLFQMKNIIILLSSIFMVSAFLNYLNSKIDSVAYFKAGYFTDLYNFANTQKEARALELLSLYLISIYALKYLQYLESVQVVFIAFKKAAFEYTALILTISVIFVGLSILTNFVFGSYIYEYKNFLDSITMNIKIFILIENTSVTGQFLMFYRVFSIFVLIIFIFLIRYFLLNLFYPIFIEYYRIEIDKFTASKNFNKNEGNDEEFNFTEKLGYFIYPCKKQKKKKVEGVMKELGEVNNDVA